MTVRTSGVRLPAAVTAVLSELSSFAISKLVAPPFAPAKDDPRLADPANSLVLVDLAEKLLKYESNNKDFTGESPTVNDHAEVEYEFFDAKGDKIGQSKGVGQMLYQREDGGFVAYFGEEIRLRDGNVIRTGGLIDDARLTAGEQATITAVGVAGPFRGAVGFRQFRPVVPHKEYASAIVLYRR
ncbi:hypothetical protein [Kutzneria buriramensis]|uniref:Allene oxide cyclase barrel-like domain-containing protein n=1 Tax=Kutzneria buriramensis TaxID=1045776 RepID=A0A3E0H6P9_9PSEU|nr:hypothetical protein [Kutzneria buriramensis]REH39152.1 hypothetical protein BCF44_1136 [Kutzneria buriramensis]